MTADHAGQTGGERRVRESHGVRSESMAEVEARIKADEQATCDHIQHSIANAVTGEAVCQRCGLHWQYTPSRPVPPAGQAAREAAVEAVAAWLWHAHMGYDMDDDVRPRTKTHYRDLARELLSLPEVAALFAAPGQEPLHEFKCPNCDATTRARMADQ